MSSFRSRSVPVSVNSLIILRVVLFSFVIHCTAPMCLLFVPPETTCPVLVVLEENISRLLTYLVWTPWTKRYQKRTIRKKDEISLRKKDEISLRKKEKKNKGKKETGSRKKKISPFRFFFKEFYWLSSRVRKSHV